MTALASVNLMALLGRGAARVLHVFIQPPDRLGVRVQDRLAGLIPVAFVWQHDQPGRAAIALDGLVHPLGLDWERPGIVVGFPVNQQQRLIDSVGMAERRDSQVNIGCLPKRASLGLEPKRGQSSVVGAASGDPGLEQVGMSQQIRGHECPVAVSAYSDPIRICHTECSGVIDRRLGSGGNLFDKRIVHGLGIPNHGHRGVIHDGIALGHQRQMTASLDASELPGRTGDLPGGGRITKFLWIGPDEQRKLSPGLVIRRQIQRR